MRRIIPFFLLLVLVTLPITSAAQESDETLQLSFTRDFGFAAGGKIQGTFSMRVREPGDLVKVEFMIDGEVVHVASEQPFRYQFSTSSYSQGIHTFSALGYKADGTPVYATEFSREFISSSDAWGTTTDILIPLLIGIGILTLLGTLGPALLARRKKHRPGEYGMSGGAICPRCTFPFSRNVLAPNLLVGKLERCPHCGKWSLVPRASAAELEAAEARLATEDIGTLEGPTEEERLRRMIEDSRFED